MISPSDFRNKAVSLRAAQQMEDAHSAVEQASALTPVNPDIAHIRAQIAFETGRSAAALFKTAQGLDPGNLTIVRNFAASLAADGRLNEAAALLEQRLMAQPEWLDGHKLLTNLRLTSGDSADFDRSYAQACGVQPQNLALRLAWFHARSVARDWNRARAIVEDGARLIGERPAFYLARLYIASESGAAANDSALFDGVQDMRDPGLDLCQTRFWLRYGDPERAEAVALRNLGTAAQYAFWPYLSIIWRLTNNAKAQWLDDPARFIRTYDLNFSAAELNILACTLRDLHISKAPFLEQSVRGGTQTDGQLFFHHDPSVQAARQKVTAAIMDYVESLPEPDASHPLLGAARGEILFEGSWSVRLTAQGFHACHTHNMGWISSALYVSLPPAASMGAAPAGWIAFGTPPPELNVDLPAYLEIAPKPARLVLFPSTMWHGTVPFNDGERMTIAFDVRRPS